MRWIRLGIVAERSRPSSPQDNGRHERMHRTLKAETLAPPAANAKRQQEAFDRWRKVYNDERPHESLEYQTPAACYTKSARAFPRRVPEVEYDTDVLVRRVSGKGDLKWQGERVFVSEIFGAQSLGLCPTHDHYYEVLYGPLRIGWLDTFRHQFHHNEPKPLRKEHCRSPWK